LNNSLLHRTDSTG